MRLVVVVHRMLKAIAAAERHRGREIAFWARFDRSVSGTAGVARELAAQPVPYLRYHLISLDFF